MTTFCTTCSQEIANVIIIEGKPYGTTCAEAIIGGKLPHWFKGGNWDTAKNQKDKDHLRQVAEYSSLVELARKAWGDFYRLSMALRKARNRGNDWEQSFIQNIATQCGYMNLFCNNYYTPDYDESEAIHNKKTSNGSWDYYLIGKHNPKGIAALSSKQLDILEKIENK
jgi:hypothetical protein